MAIRELVLASNNQGKLGELKGMLEGFGIQVMAQSDFQTPEADETAATFLENALIKARNATAYSGRPALADDSGLCVDYLDGAPGVRSARYAGPDASDSDNVQRLLQALDGVPADGRQARFVCVMALLRDVNDPLPLIAQAEWQGRIIEQPRGDGGFGYDPVFLPDGEDRTAAELPAAEKNRLSHRGQALALLQRLLRSETE